MRTSTARLLQRHAAEAFPGPEAKGVLAFQQQLEESQWFSRDKLDSYQLFNLKQLLRFAGERVAAYRDLPGLATGLQAKTLRQALDALPVLPRQALATDPLRFRADRLPTGHKLTGTKRSSGTSGQVVAVETTNIAYGWQNALTLRASLWAGRDLSRTVAGIRMDRNLPAPYPDGVVGSGWDAPTIFPFPTGPGIHLGTSASLEEQWEWLERMQPDYLMTYPSIVRAFAARAEREGHGPCRLAGITTVGESVDADLRDASEKFLGAAIDDIYSAEEIGIIALQCPTCRRYHSQDEAVIVEILDEGGRPASPGTLGRVVVTPLFNLATPLLRYDIGDIAEAGVPCSCGRGLGTFNRVVGRQRNIFKLRDGRTFWPSLGAKSFSSHVHVLQHQFRQLDYERLEVVLVTLEPVSAASEALIRAAINKRMPAPMEISFRYESQIPREAGGKYQEFVCLV